MQETILIIYLVVSIVLVGIILLQQGKGAEMGASFGAGGANTVFGAAGSGNALTKATTILAILFFAIAMAISYQNSAPAVVVDEVFDEMPAVEKKSIESQLPTDNTGGIDSELPPADPEAAKQEAADKVEAAKEDATKKVDDATKAADEEKDKSGNGQ
jgi:preprotein translocase subunit SecG